MATRRVSLGIRGVAGDANSVETYHYDDPDSIHVSRAGMSLTYRKAESGERYRVFWSYRHVVWWDIPEALWGRVLDDFDRSWDDLIEQALNAD